MNFFSFLKSVELKKHCLTKGNWTAEVLVSVLVFSCLVSRKKSTFFSFKPIQVLLSVSLPGSIGLSCQTPDLSLSSCNFITAFFFLKKKGKIQVSYMYLTTCLVSEMLLTCIFNKMKKTSELSMLNLALKRPGYHGFSSVACPQPVSAYYNYH